MFYERHSFFPFPSLEIRSQATKPFSMKVETPAEFTLSGFKDRQQEEKYENKISSVHSCAKRKLPTSFQFPHFESWASHTRKAFTTSGFLGLLFREDAKHFLLCRLHSLKRSRSVCRSSKSQNNLDLPNWALIENLKFEKHLDWHPLHHNFAAGEIITKNPRATRQKKCVFHVNTESESNYKIVKVVNGGAKDAKPYDKGVEMRREEKNVEKFKSKKGILCFSLFHPKCLFVVATVETRKAKESGTPTIFSLSQAWSLC